MAEKITPAMKKKITNDWKELYPSMEIYKPMWLMNILGPLAVGVLLHIKSDKDRYIPTLHVHNLAEGDKSISLEIEITDNNKYISTISVEEKYISIAESLKGKEVIPTEGDVELKYIISKLKEKVIESYEFDKPQILTIMAFLSGWCGKEDILKEVFEFIEIQLNTLESIQIEKAGGKEKWLSDLKEKVKNSEKLRETVNQQIIELKLDKLPVRNIIL